MKTKMKFNPQELAEKTSDAYSADSYTSWTSCARLLAKRGFDAMQAEAILRSKWTRWARDGWNKSGTPTSRALANFLDIGKHTPTSKEVIALTRETFEETP